MEDCIFCKIANKKISAGIVKETNNFIVIKDINPVAPVHLLIISKKHYDSVLNLNTDIAGGFNGSEVFALINDLAHEFNVAGSGFRIVINTGEDGGQTVNHMHIHFMAGRGFGWPPG